MKNETSKIPNSSSIITWFYYRSLAKAATFYEKILGFALVQDQGWAKIYRVKDGAFIGIVDEQKGFCHAQDESAVLLTLVVGDVNEWYQYLKGQGVNIVTQIEEKKDIQIRCFFLKDPGGYALEIQQFLDPGTALVFKTK